jgi:hypothetical protein
MIREKALFSGIATALRFFQRMAGIRMLSDRDPQSGSVEFDFSGWPQWVWTMARQFSRTVSCFWETGKLRSLSARETCSWQRSGQRPRVSV